MLRFLLTRLGDVQPWEFALARFDTSRAWSLNYRNNMKVENNQMWYPIRSPCNRDFVFRSDR